ITQLVIGTDLFVVSPLLPAISQAFSVDIGLAGLSVSAFSLGYVVAAPIFGGAGDRFGHRLVLVLGLVGFGIANLLTGAAQSFTIFIIARALAGAAAAAAGPAVYALVGQAAPVGRRGAWISTAVAGFLISLTTGAP